MIQVKKIKAGALQYVLVISLIIAILVSAFISLIYLYQKMAFKYSFTKEAIANTQMGFEYLKGNQVSYNQEIKLPFNNFNAKTYLLKKHWGIFDVATVRSKVKNEFYQKVAVLGAQNEKRDALFLKDNNQSLVLVGNTKITGKVAIPKQGVKQGNISGESYHRNQLIYGSKRVSTNRLPAIQNIASIKRLKNNYFEKEIVRFELKEGLKHHQSFFSKTLLYEDTNPITLKNISLSGNVIIVSKTTIVIDASCNLEDVILIAPKIFIQKNVQGNFQAIASKNIEVGSYCKLNYPTALILLDQETHIQKNNKNIIEEHQIKIDNNTSLKGIVLFYSENLKYQYNSQVKIDEKVIITGEVYCSKNLELLGSVFGTVYTGNFLIKKAGGIYLNHLYNAIINGNKIPNQYVGLQIEKKSNAVAKWVY